MSDYRDDMTLGEIGENDVAMVDDAIKNAKKYSFHTLLEAKMFVKHCVDITYKRHGIVVIVPKTRNKFTMLRFEKELKKMFNKAKVETESRDHRHYNGEDMWRRGIYIFCNGVLSAFISNPFMHVQEKHFQDRMRLPQKSTVGYLVITNSKTDEVNPTIIVPGTIH